MRPGSPAQGRGRGSLGAARAPSSGKNQTLRPELDARTCCPRQVAGAGQLHRGQRSRGRLPAAPGSSQSTAGTAVGAGGGPGSGGTGQPRPGGSGCKCLAADREGLSRCLALLVTGDGDGSAAVSQAAWPSAATLHHPLSARCSCRAASQLPAQRQGWLLPAAAAEPRPLRPYTAEPRGRRGCTRPQEMGVSDAAASGQGHSCMQDTGQ